MLHFRDQSIRLKSKIPAGFQAVADDMAPMAALSLAKSQIPTPRRPPDIISYVVWQH